MDHESAMKNILQGELPSEIFKRLLSGQPSLDKYEIADLWMESFPNVDTVTTQAIWGWKRPGREDGMTDENLNGFLLLHLKRANYL